MKNVFFAVIVFCAVSQISRAQQNRIPIYYSKMTVPALFAQNYYSRFDTKLLANDLSVLLNEATHQLYVCVPWNGESGNGIFLMIDTVTDYDNSETGIVKSDGKNLITIKARYITGISYAMYSWLEELGFGFYLPGAEWTIIPSIQSVFKNIINKTYRPHFALRMFSSSGTHVIKGLDETHAVEKEWLQWYQRNRMGSEYIRIDGHIGELFNVAHKAEIEQDTNLVAPINGKRQYSTSAKLDPTNKRGVSMFSDWIVQQFQRERDASNNFFPLKKYYTADAGDGVFYCHTPACQKEFLNVSDQAFSVVNETARKIKNFDSRAGVSTMAYTERADTPSFKVKPNVHVMVVPNAFQSVTTSSDLMLRWAKKTKNISEYDYLNISVWSFDKPFFHLSIYHKRLLFFDSLKIQGITFETSLSKFGSGIQQYFILKFLCEPYKSFEVVLDEFCERNFEHAAAPIKKLLKEWYSSEVHLNTIYDHPSFDKEELGRFVQYLIAAENTPLLSTKATIRIQELKAYTIYLCKYYELFADLKMIERFALNPPLRLEKIEDLLTYTWQLYDTKIFHNTQLNGLFKQHTNDQINLKWNFNTSSHFKGISKPTAEIVKENFELIKNKYLPYASPQYLFTDSFFASKASYSADSILIMTTDEKTLGHFIYPLSFYCSIPGMLKIRYRADSSQVKNKAGKIAIVSVESDNYQFIRTDFISQQNSSGVLNFKLPFKGHYKLYLSQYNATHIAYVIYPGKSLFYHNKKSIMMSGMAMHDFSANKTYSNRRLGFYAPAVDSIYFTNLYYNSSNTSLFYTASGKRIPIRENKNSLFNIVAVPAESRNNFIYYENPVYRWPPVLQNAPPYYFFLKDSFNGPSK